MLSIFAYLWSSRWLTRCMTARCGLHSSWRSQGGTWTLPRTRACAAVSRSERERKTAHFLLRRRQRSCEDRSSLLGRAGVPRRESKRRREKERERNIGREWEAMSSSSFVTLSAPAPSHFVVVVLSFLLVENNSRENSRERIAWYCLSGERQFCFCFEYWTQIRESNKWLKKVRT